MTNLETDVLEVLTREAVRLFTGPLAQNACGPLSGLLSMVCKESDRRDARVI